MIATVHTAVGRRRRRRRPASEGATLKPATAADEPAGATASPIRAGRPAPGGCGDRSSLLARAGGLTDDTRMKIPAAQLEAALAPQDRPPGWTAIAEFYGLLAAIGQFDIAVDAGGTVYVARRARRKPPQR